MIIRPDDRGAWANTATSALPVTPDDNNDLAVTTRGLYIGGTGNLKVTMLDGTTVTFTGIVGGVFHPLCVNRVYATGTTATGIIAVY